MPHSLQSVLRFYPVGELLRNDNSPSVISSSPSTFHKVCTMCTQSKNNHWVTSLGTLIISSRFPPFSNTCLFCTHPNIWNVQSSFSWQLARNRGLVTMSCCRHSWMTSFEIHYCHQRAAETCECVSRNGALNSFQFLMVPACRTIYHVITVFPQLLSWTLAILNIDVDSFI